VYLVAGINPWSYALTQCEVIVHYLRLALWPTPLVFDYSWPIVENPWSVAPAATIVLMLLTGTVMGLYRRMWIGFWGAWFFLILGPTSSVMPLADVAFEHRMYLPLAAVVAIGVIAVRNLCAHIGSKLRVSAPVGFGVQAALLAIVVSALAYTTVRRNDDYRSELAIWSDTLGKRPANARAHLNFGLAIKAQGDLATAITHYDEALRLKPDLPEAHNNLGNALALEGRLPEAIDHYRRALQLRPKYVQAHLNYGTVLVNQGRFEDAIDHYNQALQANPNHAGGHNDLGMALAHEGRLAEAAAHFASAVRIDPGFAKARSNLHRIEAALSIVKDRQ
jgi:protein O-mannosyl-transferase